MSLLSTTNDLTSKRWKQWVVPPRLSVRSTQGSTEHQQHRVVGSWPIIGYWVLRTRGLTPRMLIELQLLQTWSNLTKIFKRLSSQRNYSSGTTVLPHTLMVIREASWSTLTCLSHLSLHPIIKRYDLLQRPRSWILCTRHRGWVSKTTCIIAELQIRPQDQASHKPKAGSLNITPSSLSHQLHQMCLQPCSLSRSHSCSRPNQNRSSGHFTKINQLLCCIKRISLKCPLSPKGARKKHNRALAEAQSLARMEVLVIPITKTSKVYRKRHRHLHLRKRNRRQSLNRFIKDKFFNRKLIGSRVGAKAKHLRNE